VNRTQVFLSVVTSVHPLVIFVQKIYSRRTFVCAVCETDIHWSERSTERTSIYLAGSQQLMTSWCLALGYPHEPIS